MPRRVSLPGAEELFGGRSQQPTGVAVDPDTPADSDGPEQHRSGAPDLDGPATDGNAAHAGAERTDGTIVREQPRPVSRTRSDEARTPEAPSARRGRRRGSGRVRHDEKITVYVSRDELLALERARLTLRAEHGMAADRGRIVREALALVLDDLAEHGADSDLVRRLTQP